MPSPIWQGSAAFNQLQVAAVQANSASPIDASEGSVTLALTQGNTGAALWLQSEVVQTLALTRAATSQGTDLDTWLADWGIARTPATAAQGSLTFSRYTNLSSVTIPVGAIVSTGPGGSQFQVVLDITNTAYAPLQGGYVMAQGVSSVTVPAQAVTPGSTGDALPGTLTSFVTPVIGVDSVTNAQFAGGEDEASDASARAMFQSYIGSLNHGTPAAIAYAVQRILPNAIFAIAENTDTSGAYRPGWFVVTVDDGSGNPPDTLLQEIRTSIESYRAVGTFPAVQPPTITPVIVSLDLRIDPSASQANALAAMNAAVFGFANALGIGQPLPYLRVAQLIFDSTPSITAVSNVLVNNGTADVAVGQFGVVRITSVVPTILNT